MMREVRAKLGADIQLGREGENLATRVVFDVSDWDGGSGSIHLLHQRSCDETPYPCPITVGAGYAVWVITETDVAVAGRGRAELRYLDGAVCVKSSIFKTSVTASLGAEGEIPPDPEASWVNKVLSAADSIADSADRAAKSAKEAENAVYRGLETAKQSGVFDGPQGPKGDTGATGPQGPAGPAGPAGSDATVTAANIKSALGYTPADAQKVSQLSEEKADKEYVVSIFEEIKRLLQNGEIDSTVALLDKAILDLSTLA